ncbi:protein JASON isoform X2 [Aristolochia californica]|uniref:protein JASON isoform X2 n=1 Tax=Aristolochia californica TaxID=171875 RepID=UPI0035DFBEE5
MHRDQVNILGRLLLDVFSCMGCFFGCFRVKDGNRRQPPLVSDRISSKDPLASKSRLASLLLEDQNAVKHTKSHDLQPSKITDGRGSEDQELKDEAKFLKSCGALLQTPVEIRKRLEREKLEVGYDASSKYHSWLPGTACKKENSDEQQSQNPHSSYKLQEEKNELSVPERSALPEEKSRSFMPELQKMERCSGGSLNRSELEPIQPEVQRLHEDYNELPATSSELPVSKTQCRTKSVRFENDNLVNTEFVSTGSTPLRNETRHRKQCDSPDSDDGKHKLVGPRYSPYPTPLRLTDDMQTPGTVYPAKTLNFAMGRNPRVRSLYVYPVLNPVENISQWNALKEDSDTFQVHSSGEISNLNKASSCEDREHGAKCLAILDQQNPLPVDASLSHWVKPASKDERNASVASPSKGMSDSGRSTEIDRPIIGLVATHWNDEEPSQIPPKEWDGNGIPNSTTKYKEDQKVSWHATPFEERLEKALSDERLLPRKLLTGTPIHFEESEESDTATSFLSIPPT